MTKSSEGALFVGFNPTGIMLAETSSFSPPIQITKLESFETHDIIGSPLCVISDLALDKKGYVDAQFCVSHSGFFHLLHEVDVLVKAKAPDYFPNVVKEFLQGKNDDVFYHVTNSGDGEPYSPDNITEKQLIISGIQTKTLVELQNSITEQGFYPKKIQCSSLATLGLIKKFQKDEAVSTPMIVLEVFKDTSLLVIVPTEGKPLFRSIPCGEEAMCEQIRDELGLKDLASSQKLLYSTTIDLSDIGRQVVSPIFKEVAATVGMHEVDTGQSIAKLFVSNLPPKHKWIAELLAQDLGMDLYRIDHDDLLKKLELEVGSGVEWDRSDPRYVSLFATMGQL